MTRRRGVQLGGGRAYFNSKSVTQLKKRREKKKENILKKVTLPFCLFCLLKPSRVDSMIDGGGIGDGRWGGGGMF